MTDKLDDAADSGYERFFEVEVTRTRSSFRPRLLAEHVLENHKLPSDPSRGERYLKALLSKVIIEHLDIKATRSRIGEVLFWIRILSETK